MTNTPRRDGSADAAAPLPGVQAGAQPGAKAATQSGAKAGAETGVAQPGTPAGAQPGAQADARPGVGSAGAPSPSTGRVAPLPVWPFLLLTLGWLLGGAGGLLVAGVAAAVILLLRLRLQVANPQLPDLPMLRRKQVPPPMPGFTRTVSAVEWGLNSAYDYDAALRPRIRRALAARIAERHRLDLTEDAPVVRAMIGEDLWPLVDPARPPSRDRESAGPSPQMLARLIDAIERI